MKLFFFLLKKVRMHHVSQTYSFSLPEGTREYPHCPLKPHKLKHNCVTVNKRVRILLPIFWYALYILYIYFIAHCSKHSQIFNPCKVTNSICCHECKVTSQWCEYLGKYFPGKKILAYVQKLRLHRIMVYTKCV